MRKRALELRPKIIEAINKEGKYRGKERLLFVHYNLYYGLVTSTIGDTFNTDLVVQVAGRVLFNYLSVPFKDIDNRLTFIFSFMQTYKLFSVEVIISSQFEESSPIYDNSIEANIARLLAIGEKEDPNFVKKSLDYIETILDI